MLILFGSELKSSSLFFKPRECLSGFVSQLLIEQGNYPHLTTYVIKADSTLEVAAQNASASSSSGTAAASQLHKKATQSEERTKVQMKLDVATALSHLGQSNYKKAAQTFLKVGPPKGLEDWEGKVRLRILSSG